MNLAIILAVSEYGTDDSLPSCANDGKIVAEIIALSRKFDHCLLVVSDTTASAVKAKLDDFVSQHRNEHVDEIFFYYCGQAYQSADDFYLALSDFDANRPRQTCLMDSYLDGLLRSFSPRLVTKIVDACVSRDYDVNAISLPSIVRVSKRNFSTCYLAYSLQAKSTDYSSMGHGALARSFTRVLARWKPTQIAYPDILDAICDDWSDESHRLQPVVEQKHTGERDVFCELTPPLKDSAGEFDRRVRKEVLRYVQLLREAFYEDRVLREAGYPFHGQAFAEAARLGDPDAQFAVGWDGRFGGREPWYKMAERENQPDVLYLKARELEFDETKMDGNSPRTDTSAEYERLLLQAANHNIRSAQWDLGKFYMKASPDKRCLFPENHVFDPRALDWLARAAEGNWAPGGECFFDYAWALEKGGQHREAATWYEKSLLFCDTEVERRSSFRLVVLLVRMLGPQQAAVEILRLSHLMFEARGKDVGFLCMEDGCEECDKKEECAVRRDPGSLLNCAVAFANRPRDEANEKWEQEVFNRLRKPFAQLADAGCAEARRLLGENFEREKARDHLLQAARAGDKQALFLLAQTEDPVDEDADEPLEAVYPKVVDLLLAEVEQGCGAARDYLRSIIENVSTWISGHLEDHASLRDEKEQSDRELECLRTAQKTGVEEWEKAGCPKGRIHDFIEQAECRLG